MEYLTKWGGGGYRDYPQLGQTSASKRAKYSSQNLQNFVPKGIKTKYSITKTTQMMLWLLVLSIFAAFSLCPLAEFATRYNLTAGGPSDDTFYINAPVFIAGDSGRDKDGRTGSTILDNTNSESGKVTSANVKPLFKTGGAVDTEVLSDLVSMVDSKKVWGDTTKNVNAPTYLTAKNFGQYGTQDGWTADQKGNAQILVKLFEDTNDTTYSANTASAQYWQAVYRSINGENDVLTLYMARPYVSSVLFNPSKIIEDNNKTYRYEGNYSQSYLRDKNVLPLYETLDSKYGDVFDKYVVAPSQLAADALNLGGWQSSAYQTSYNSSRELYTTNNGIGSSGYMDDVADFGLENGMDGLSGKHSRWSDESTVESVYNDKLWVPSGFEVLHTGYGQNAESKLQDTGRVYDEANDIIYLDGYLDGHYSEASAKIDSGANTASHTNANRTGLWELNAYDRASASCAWLRSGYSTYYYDKALGIDSNGGSYNQFVYEVNETVFGVRVALHLSLGALKPLLPKQTTLNISATNNSVNGLLVLTVMDGNTRIAGYSCIGGSINVTLMLDWNKIYRILATRPFGSCLEVKLDDILQSPTVFACYEIQTAENYQMDITFALSGDGSWKNCVVV